MSDARLQLSAAIEELGLTVDSTFIPWSQLRNKDERNPSLNWRVTLKHHGREVLTTEYSAGMAHCPGYRGPAKYERDQVCRWECEHGRPGYWRSYGVEPIKKAVPITPDPVNVVWSLSQDTYALDYPTYEDFASEYGYDADSRKGEAIYRACLETALKLRAALGDAGLARLREAGEGY